MRPSPTVAHSESFRALASDGATGCDRPLAQSAALSRTRSSSRVRRSERAADAAGLHAGRPQHLAAADVAQSAAGTRELAVIVEDPDAGSPPPYVHWLIYKIPATAKGLPDGSADRSGGADARRDRRRRAGVERLAARPSIADRRRRPERRTSTISRSMHSTPISTVGQPTRRNCSRRCPGTSSDRARSCRFTSGSPGATGAGELARGGRGEVLNRDSRRLNETSTRRVIASRTLRGSRRIAESVTAEDVRAPRHLAPRSPARRERARSRRPADRDPGGATVRRPCRCRSGAQRHACCRTGPRPCPRGLRDVDRGRSRHARGDRARG